MKIRKIENNSKINFEKITIRQRINEIEEMEKE